MNTTEDRVREVLGHLADEAPVPLGFEELAQPTVVAPPSVPTGRGWAVTAMVVAVVLIVGGLVVGSRLQPTPAASVSRTVDDLRRALDDGATVLSAGGGARGTQVATIHAHEAARVWFASGAGGERVVVQRADRDVRDSAWWLTSATPPREGENFVTNAWVVVGGTLYEAGPESASRWRVSDRDPGAVLAFGLAVLDPASVVRQMVTPNDATVKSQVGIDGSTTWTVTYRDGGRARFVVGLGGALRSWSLQGEPGPEAPPFDSVLVSYTPLQEPPLLVAPQPGAPLDVSVFDLLDIDTG